MARPTTLGPRPPTGPPRARGPVRLPARPALRASLARRGDGSGEAPPRVPAALAGHGASS